MAVEKARKAAQKEIDKGNYTPYFPLEERYYVDVTSYPLTGNTLKDTLPKKAETLAKHTATYDTPAARKTLSEAYERGSQFPMTKDWYATGQLENEFIKDIADNTFEGLTDEQIKILKENLDKGEFNLNCKI